jgi:hypothetical protein
MEDYVVGTWGTLDKQILFWKRKGKGLLKNLIVDGKPMTLRIQNKFSFEDIDCIHLVQWWAHSNTALNFLFPYKASNILTDSCLSDSQESLCSVELVYRHVIHASPCPINVCFPCLRYWNVSHCVSPDNELTYAFIQFRDSFFLCVTWCEKRMLQVLISFYYTPIHHYM